MRIPLRCPKGLSLAEKIIFYSSSADDGSDCVICMTSPNRFGHCPLVWEGRQQLAHRLSWESRNGTKIPEGMVVRHTCDRPDCINPDHLRLGTQRENIIDMVSRGRHGKHFSRPKFSRLTDNNPADILLRKSYLDGAGCRVWSGYLMPSGHGRLSVRKRMVLAHRLAWELANGPIPSRKVIRHMCHNPSCINVVHLAIGTQADNMADSRVNGRLMRKSIGVSS